MLGRLAIGDRIAIPPEVTVSLSVAQRAPGSDVGHESSLEINAGRISGRLALVPFADVADILVLAAGQDDSAFVAAVSVDSPDVDVRLLAAADPAIRPCRVVLSGANAVPLVSPSARAGHTIEDLLTLAFALTSMARPRRDGCDHGCHEGVCEESRPIRSADRLLPGCPTATCRHGGRCDGWAKRDDHCFEGHCRGCIQLDAESACSKGVYVSSCSVRRRGSVADFWRDWFTEDHSLHVWFKHGLSLAAA
jgi:hypothetical protein